MAEPMSFDPTDVATLTRLANEMFKEVTGGASLPQNVTLPVSPVPPSAPPGTQGLPSTSVTSWQSLAPAAPAAPPVASPFAAPSAPSFTGISPQTDPARGAAPPVRVPPQQLDSSAVENLQLPHVYGGAAEIPRIAFPRLVEPALPAEAARGTPRFYFVDAPQVTTAPGTIDPFRIKQDFPILRERINGKELVWLDNAATTQKPQVVIDRLAHFYEHENSNIHRAAHELAARATDAYEGARATAQRFLNARSSNEIIFVRGATEGINLIAKSWGRQHIGKGDEIIVSHLEHHANIVPWKQLADEVGATLKVIPVDDRGQLRLDAYAQLLTPKTKLVAVTQVSNALGTITPASEIVRLGHAVGARVLVDGAQSVLHMPTDVQALDADWFVFSGHKVFGPTGIGVLYGKEDLLNDTQPWQGGGNMIEDVTFEQIRYHDAPDRFEAGTGNIADAAGLAAALDYVQAIGLPAIAAHEHGLLEYGTHLLSGIPGLRMIGTAQEKAGVLSFVIDGCDPVDIGKALNREGIAVRAGHHCAQPILRRFGLEATVRPSLALYNTTADLDALASTLRRYTSRSHSVSMPGVG
jgi:cysteine desulfurase/selenocysteine lyase